MSLNWWVEGQVGWVEIANPPLNILTPAVREELLAALSDLEQQGVRVVVLTGAGDRAFCAGADLGEEADLTAESVWHFIAQDRETYNTVDDFPVPVIGAINGHCMGGGLELALACDIRLAAEHARFRCPGVRVGLVANAARLVRLIGEAPTKELILTGRDFSAAEAVRLGIVAQAVPGDRLRAEAKSMAEVIASRAPLAVKAGKRVCRAASELSFSEALAVEEREFASLTQTRDHKHALDAFFKKEAPRFMGE